MPSLQLRCTDEELVHPLSPPIRHLLAASPVPGARTMSRISLLEEFPAEASDFVDRVRRQRRGTLLKLYKALLHSPPLAESWFGHMNAVRWGSTLSGRLRELIVIRIAAIHATAYVIRQHVPALAEADGVSIAECEALEDW